MVEITPDIQKIIDAADAMEEVVSLEVKEVPAFELSQVPPGDYLYFDFTMKVKNGDTIPVAFVVPTETIDENTHTQLAIKDLAECNCVRTGDAEDQYCVDNPFYNRGKTTYYIRPGDYYLVRIEAQYPKVFPLESLTPSLKAMAEKLKELDRVNFIQVEEVLDQQLVESTVFNNYEKLVQQTEQAPVMIWANVQLDSQLANTVDLSFICSAWQYNGGPDYIWAVNNLREMINAAVERAK
jgi:hypothetical protein